MESNTISSASISVVLEDVRNAETLEELKRIYEESKDLHSVDEFIQAHVRKWKLLEDEVDGVLETDEVGATNNKEDVMEGLNRNEEIAALAEQIGALKALLEARTRKSGGKRRSKHVAYKLLKTRIDWAETPQMWTTVDILAAIGADKAAISNMEIEAAMEKNEGLFDITGEKQTATRIWRYYRKELLDHGVIEEVKQQNAVVVA